MCSNNTVFHGYGPYNRSYSPRTPSVQLAVGVLQDLLQYSSQLPELAREVGLNSILGILTSLLGLKSECHLAAIEGSTACISLSLWLPEGQTGCLFLSQNGQCQHKSTREGTVQYEGPGVELLS
uniref:Uncharacterized protein n=1 Tax=Oncorhynchus tshawytscha TaxID=74940 RepID=A0AAZ3RDI8_ONCTS